MTAPFRRWTLFLAATCSFAHQALASSVVSAQAPPTFVMSWGGYGSQPGLMNYPYGITASPSGHIYVTDQYNFRIVQFTSTGTFVRAWGSQGTGQGQFGTTIGLCVDAQDRVFVSDYGNSRIQVFTSDGQFLRMWGTSGSGPGQFAGPRDVAVDAAGRVHVVDGGNQRIQTFTAEGVYVESWGFGIQGGVSLAFDPSGNAFVGEGNQISLWSPSRSLIRRWGQLLVVSGVAADASGNVYATEWEGNRVHHYAPDGTLLRQWGSTGNGPGQFDHPADVTVDAGFIYVLDMYNHRVQKFGDAPGPPTIGSLEPAGGRVGDPVAIHGNDFTGASSVRFNGVDALFAVTSDSRIDTTVPAGATTGRVTITTPLGTGTSPADFFVGETPVLTSATPIEGKIGTEVVIAGAHFTGATRVAFGPASSASFTVDSDAQITAVVDGGASTAPISVTTPAATGTSAFTFTFIPFDTAGRIVSVRDVPRDQGGLVAVKWMRSDFDRLGGFITSYRLWRRAPSTVAFAAAAGWWARPTSSGAIDFWEPVASIPAARLDGYAFLAATTEDSTEEANPHTAFFVQTLTGDPTVFYNSPIDSGYSVDNRGPKKPNHFAATYTARGAILHWEHNDDADLRGYRLHRGSRMDFVPDTGNVIYAGQDTTFTDSTRANAYYLLAAQDRHGNLSRYALVTPQGSQVGIAIMVETRAAPDRVTVRWYVIGQPRALVFVERRLGSAAWQRVANVQADELGNVTYTDTEVSPGQRLGYRIGVLEDEVELFSSEVRVEVPEARLALLGASPNPLPAGKTLSLSFLLPAEGRATFRVLDVAGRVLLTHDLGHRAAGRHDRVPIPWASRPAVGIYFGRLELGGRSVTTKLGIFR